MNKCRRFVLTIDPISEGTLTTDPILEGIPRVALPFQCVAEEKATASQPTIKEGEEIVEVSESEDDFEVFNQPLTLETLSGDLIHPLHAQASQAQGESPLPEDMGIQHKPQAGLLVVMESQAGDKVLEKVAQAKLLPPLPTQPL